MTGVDGKGESPGSAVTMSIPAGASQTFTASELESGSATGLRGALGDGYGMWQLIVESDRDLVVMSLLSDPAGHLTNLSTAPGNEDDGLHSVPLFPSASDTDGRQGFVRVINLSGEAGEVTIQPYDDATWEYDPLTLAIGSNEAVHFDSDDLELGNIENGLSGSTGPGESDWWLELSSDLDIEVVSYIRTEDGFLTAMHDKAPTDGDRHRVAIFNPGINEDQKSLMRLVNAGAEDATAEIAGIDDRGESTGSAIRVTVPARASKTLSAMALESGDEFMDGALGDGVGKWQLSVETETPLVVMSLLESRTGHLTNPSTAPTRGAGPPPIPDLTVESPSLTDSTPDAGDLFTVSATVRNDGDGTSAATTLRYYRSTDATITTADTQVGTETVVELAAGASSEKRVSVAAPAAGIYYYGACVDAVTGESDTTNNCSGSVQVTVSTAPPGPDLTIYAIVASTNPSGTPPGGMIGLSAGVENEGDQSSAATTVRFYQSTDATITTADTQVGTDAVGELSAGATISTQNIDVTAPSDAGTYYYGACVDSVTGESDTTNNCGGSVAVTVGAAAQHPDLEVGTPTVSDSSPETGAAFTLSATVRNAGDAGSAATTLRYYRSTDATISSSDTAVGTDSVGALAASGTSAESISVTGPGTAGTYYYGACVDAVADESDTTDNCSGSVAVTVEAAAQRPDLTVGTPTASDSSPETGGAFWFIATVHNQGDAQAAATTVRYLRSTDGTITTSDTLEGTDAVGALGPLQNYGATILLTAPSTAGTYYYGACVDAVPAESDTTNNCSGSVAVTVEAAVQRPDLTVGTPTVSDSSPETGAAFTLSATVRNAGDAGSAATTLRYYRSTDATISSSDTAVGTDSVGALAASGTSAESISVTAPGTAGTYYYGACVDAVADESDTTDNCSGSVAVTVEAAAQRPDLEVGTPTASDSSPETGTSFTLSATVRNAGDRESAATTLRFYRSTDATITTLDTLVGTVAVGTLPASSAFAAAIVVTAPSTAGTYYYGACVDAVADESDTTDNCSGSVAVTVEAAAQHPDLTVGSPSVTDSTPDTGDLFTVSATVTNDGDGTSATTTLRYYRSTDATITTADTQVGTDTVGELSTGASTEKRVSVAAPAAGTYYYGACVDAVTGESDTTNNCSGSVPVTVGGS